MKLIKIAFFVFSLIASLAAFSQSIPEVGKRCPDFKLSHVTHYSKKKASLDDFEGKWLFLDFWFTGCSTCLTSFSKISELQKEFSGRAQFLLVGYNSRKSERNIEETFERLRIKKGLKIVSAYDSILAHAWGIKSMPHIVIVDPSGIVRSITDGSDMTSEKIKHLLNGEPVSFFEKEAIRSPFVNNLVDYNGNVLTKDRIRVHSLLTNWNGEQANAGYEIGEYVNFPANEREDIDFNFSCVTLQWLYSIAYLEKNWAHLKFWSDSLYGNVYPFPILQIQDSSLFKYNFENGRGLFNYSLHIPSDKISKPNLMKFMQEDLYRSFGYNAFVEEREMPIWKLVSKPGAECRLKSKGGKPYNDAWERKSIVTGFAVRNIAIKEYLTYLCFYLNESEKHPFIDATEINVNIDLEIDADLTNIHDVKRELKKHGLDLVLGTRKMKVLIIAD